jgi:uncharacterized protein involved in exopolysaccharide biosynthesis
MPVNPAAAPVVRQDEISFLIKLVRLVIRRKWLILSIPFSAALLSGLITFLALPDFYTASARILPPSSMPSASAALMAQLGGISSPALNMVGMRNSSDLYVAMLRSRTVADALIAKFKLGAWYGQEYPTRTRSVLAKMSRISYSRDGVVSIEVDDVDPLRAMEMANTYVNELNRINRTLSSREATQRRVFYEQQLSLIRNNLAEAENRARQAMNKSGLVNVSAQAQALVATTARLRGQISAAEVRIAAMRGYVTSTNPALLQAQRELTALQRELARTEGGQTGKTESPEAGNDNLRLLREVKYNETLHELISKQYEMAKLDEAKDPGALQILDWPVHPDMPSGPNRIAIILIITMVAAGFALLLAYLLDAIARAKGQLSTSRV